MDNKTFVRRLKKLGACQPAIDWVKEHGGTAQECWNDCKNGRWMDWLIDHHCSRETIEQHWIRWSWWADCMLKIITEAQFARKLRKHIPTIYEDK